MPFELNLRADPIKLLGEFWLEEACGHHRPPCAGAIFIATGPDEYFVAGNGVAVTFTPNTPGPPLAGLATVEEGTFVDGRWVPGRRLAGDDTIEGDCIQLRWPLGTKVPLWAQRWSGEGIQRVTL